MFSFPPWVRRAVSASRLLAAALALSVLLLSTLVYSGTIEAASSRGSAPGAEAALPGQLADVAAEITSPTPGSLIGRSFVTFNWTAGTNATEYWVYVGNSPGSYEFANQGVAGQSFEIGNVYDWSLPNSYNFYVRLWTKFDSTWQFRDYTYTVDQSLDPAEIIDPTDNSFILSTITTFTWNTGTDVREYWLYLGTSRGDYDMASMPTGTATSASWAPFESDGSVVWARLWSRFDSGWVVKDFSYTTADYAQAEMISPVPGSALTGGTTTFNWSRGDGTGYIIEVGTQRGGAEIATVWTGDPRQLGAAALTATIAGIPTSGPVHVRLWTDLGWWLFEDYAYTGAP